MAVRAWRACSRSLALGALLAAPTAGAAETAADFTLKPLPLPGATGTVALDYFVYDAAHRRLWVPASNTGNVDVIDVDADAVRPLAGFKTVELEFLGKRRLIGPSSVTLGRGVAYVGNRADSSICVVDSATFVTLNCVTVGTPAEGLAAAPDSLTYVAKTRELWVTRGAPPLGVASADLAISIFDASQPEQPRPAAKIALAGSAEGFAVDDRRGRFYTNVEESGVTVAIDLRSRRVTQRWKSGCDEPHGLALDAARGFLFVACNARVVVLDAGRDGRVLGAIDTGEGVDNIAYLESTRTLYVAAAVAERLTVAEVDAAGVPHARHSIPTVKGTRGVVVDDLGRAYLIDPLNGRILKVSLVR